MKKLTESEKRGSKIAAYSQGKTRSRRIRKRSVIPARAGWRSGNWKQSALSAPNSARTARKELNRFDGVLTLRLPALLRLSPEQIKALSLIIAWEGKTLTEYIRWCLLPSIRASFDEIRGFAGQLPGYRTANKRNNQREQAWAKKFHKELEPLMAGKEEEYAG